MIETIIGRQFPTKVIPLIDKSSKSIDVIVFDWRWYPQDPGASVQLFNQAIVRAVRRGVKVRVITNSGDIVSILNDLGCQAKKLISKNLVHAKMMLIDSETVIVGSHNYTQSAFQMNYELSVILDKPENISDYFSFFDNLYNSNG